MAVPPGASLPLAKFGLLACIAIALLLFPIAILHDWQFSHHPVGVWVGVVRPSVQVAPSPGIQPLVVRVATEGIFVDSRGVSWKELDAVLQKEIVQRPPDWPVYVQGGRERLEWSAVCRVIDAIRGRGARVVLLTHQRRAVASTVSK